MNALVIACLLLALLHGHQPVLATSTQEPTKQPTNTGLLPPVGNSEALVSQCTKATRTYKCNKGKWEFKSSFADLVSDVDSSHAVGNYTFASSPIAKSEWHLLNSQGDLSESGLQCTVFRGKVLYNGRDGQMYQITSRNVEGSYAYIVTRSQGGSPPRRACKGCETVTVPFSASHTFYTQDLVPPPTGALALPSNQRPVQSLFCSGYVKWTRVAGGKWDFTGAVGTVSTCPGGKPEGSFSIRPGYSATWTLSGPYGWSVTGTSVKSVTRGPQDWPWQLYRVTSSRGSELLGKKTYVHFVSTRGGIPPKAGGRIGATYSAPFSGIAWFYTTNLAI